MQGRLTQTKLEARIETTCACCDEPLDLRVGSDLSYEVRSDGAQPLVSVPFVDFQKLADPSIIHAF